MRKKVQIFICFNCLAIILIFSGCSKKIVVQINKEVDNKSLLPYSLLAVPQTIDFRNQLIPDNLSGLDTSLVFYYPIGYHETSQRMFEKRETPLFIDTLYFFAANKNGNLVFMGDQNFDKNFKNDSLVIVKGFFNDKENSWLHQYENKFNYSFYMPFLYKDVRRVIPFKFNIDVYKNVNSFKNKIPYSPNDVSMNFSAVVGFKYKSFRTGIKKYYLISDDLIKARLMKNYGNRIYVLDRRTYKEIKHLRVDDSYVLNDIIRIGRKDWEFTYQSFEGDTVELTRIKKRKDLAGNKVGEYAYSFKKNDINGNLISTDSLNNKPTLLIFWGWWCAPCLHQLPEYVTLYNKVKTNINFISVALDTPGDIVFTEEEVRKNNMQWPTIIADINSNKKTELNNLFNVHSVSTYILIDKSKKIVYRGSDFNKVNDLLLKQ